MPRKGSYPEWPEEARIARREYARQYKYQYKYGISVERYQELLVSQGGSCALCGSVPIKRSLAVDHCHETGRVRGLLCLACNGALGKLGDDVNSIRRVLDYLEGEQS